MDALKGWILAAEAVRATCQNKPVFDRLIDLHRRRLREIEKRGSTTKRREGLIPTAELSRDVSNFMIGFGKIDVKDNAEVASSAGSGTLVTVDSIQGILTAAHVLDALPNSGHVAIILPAQSPAQFRRSVIDMGHTSKLRIGSADKNQDGPDLGVLRLAPNDAASLSAIASFYNITRWANEMIASGVNALKPHFVDAVCGIVHERTRLLAVDRGRRATSFDGVFVGGQTSIIRYVNDYDLVDFEVTDKPDFPLPQSFEGTSGGALWRFYYKVVNEQPSVISRRLYGVPFWQSLTADGRKILTCHGPKSVYENVVVAVTKEWG
jgi:hypothetical protein